jgi:restriction endonuclease S subunit
MKPEFDRLMMGSTHQTIYMPDVRQFRGPLPPIAEQAAIAAYLDPETIRFGAAADKINRQLDRLQEYRQALITAAVTGQLDIGAAA